MEQTLGKRIITNRKRIGFTQDQLAERLGVTAQAVSKWENDQSCPDISMLPKLADIFGISIDELLGVEPVHQGEIVEEPEEEDHDDSDFHISNGNIDFKIERNSSLGFAVLVLAVGGLTLASELLHWDVSFWGILWPTALMVYGLCGIVPRFSFFRMGCLLFGGYSLLNNLNVLPFQLGWNLVFPAILLLFGVSLLVDNLFRPKRKHSHHFSKRKSFDFNISGNSFNISTCFCEERRTIQMPLLSSGNISNSFAECTVDLSGVENVTEDCKIDASCSFGELTILIPRRFRVQCNNNTSFSHVQVYGEPDADAQNTIRINADVSFGEMKIQYL